MSTQINVDKIQELLASGNIDQFTAQERVAYINKVCEMTGLNPLTRPFEYIRFQGKTVLYAGKGCADQLRKIHGVSITDIKHEIMADILTVTVKGQDKTGRIDSEIGALSIAGLKGEALANATMKTITKAKRRLTLSMVGLGILDEMEVESLNGAYTQQAAIGTLVSSEDILYVRAKLVEHKKHEEDLVKFINGQFKNKKPEVSRIEEFDADQILSAKSILAGKPKQAVEV